ncbi:MAG: hypothetical protein IJB71_02200 [Bacilli bacterium]|nr:hypothetical protein [Bacilli bacterium]
MKRMLSTLIVTIISAFALTINVNAAVGTAYTVTVAAGDTTYVNSNITPGRNYPYTVNEISAYAGSASVHTTLQTLYNGSYVTISPTLSLSRVGSAAWRPSAVGGNPTGFTVRTGGTCSGSNTSSTACALSGARYRFYLVNKNILNHFSVSGHLYYAD